MDGCSGIEKPGRLAADEEGGPGEKREGIEKERDRDWKGGRARCSRVLR